MPRVTSSEGGGGGGGGGSSATPLKPSKSAKHSSHRSNDLLLNSNHQAKQEPNTSNDDLASSDEIKVYKDEGAYEEEEQNLDNLNKDKIDLVNETEEEKPSVHSHAFSINNMLYSGQDQLNQAAMAQVLSRNLYQQAMYRASPDLASLAWWQGAAGLQNPLFQLANPLGYAAMQQHAMSAAMSQFNPFLIHPPPGLSPNHPAVSPSLTRNLNGLQQQHNSQPSASSSASSSNRHNQFSQQSSSRMMNSNGQMNGHTPNRPHGNTGGHHHHSGSGGGAGSHKKSHGHHHNHHHGLNGSIKQENDMPHENEKKSSKLLGPHIKKPLNAFMLFMKEQRAKVVSECTLRESAAINQILGRKWHELDRTEQAKYYEIARQERLKHMQQYPGWSARDNYGIKKKRRRKREKVIGENGELPRKCRARYGLHQINLWCKPCRRKKKCIRFSGQEDGVNPQMQMQNGMVNGMPNGGMPGLGYPMNGLIPNLHNGMFSSGSVGEGSSAGVGSSGSINGVNSEEDDYDGLEEDDDDDDEEDDDDGENDDLDDDMDDSRDSDTENKNHHLPPSQRSMNSNSQNSGQTNGNSTVPQNSSHNNGMPPIPPNLMLPNHSRSVGQSIGNCTNPNLNLNGFNPNLNLHPLPMPNGLLANPLLLDHPLHHQSIKSEGL